MEEMCIRDRVCHVLHEHHVKIVLDGVFNHVGRGFWAFQDVQEKKWDSPYKDWFHPVSYTHLDVYKRQILPLQRVQILPQDGLTAHGVHQRYLHTGQLDVGGHQIYTLRVMQDACLLYTSALTQKSSPALPSPFVFAIKVVTSFKMSFSL